MIETLILALAAWRITSLLVCEDGPNDVIAKFRNIIGVRYDQYSVPYGKNIIASLFTCVWCLSIWVSAIFALLSPYSTNVIWYLVAVLALSTIVIVVDTIINSIKHNK